MTKLPVEKWLRTKQEDFLQLEMIEELLGDNSSLTFEALAYFSSRRMGKRDVRRKEPSRPNDCSLVVRTPTNNLF